MLLVLKLYSVEPQESLQRPQLHARSLPALHHPVLDIFVTVQNYIDKGLNFEKSANHCGQAFARWRPERDLGSHITVSPVWVFSRGGQCRWFTGDLSGLQARSAGNEAGIMMRIKVETELKNENSACRTCIFVGSYRQGLKK